jgi:quercetin dioxygenase-like cupin family protein
MKGEAPANPKILNENFTPAEYAEWVNRSDMQSPGEFDDIHVKLIAHTPQATTAIVWIETMAPHEVHHNEYEKFLILEGTYDIISEETVHKLVTGSYFQIPLHEGHRVIVTSEIPCKVILQRVAA